MKKFDMNRDIKQFPVYAVTSSGIVPADWIKSTDDYNHLTHHLHHYIQKQGYAGNQEWYKSRGIEQKLFLMPIWLHEQVHNQAIKNLSDEEFKRKYKIARWDLIFNRKYSKY